MSKVVSVLFIFLVACSETVTTTGTCIEDNQCAYPRVCRSGTCVVQCFLDTECIDGETCRFNRCVAPDVDARTNQADADLVDVAVDSTVTNDLGSVSDSTTQLDLSIDASASSDATQQQDSTQDATVEDDADNGARPDGSTADMHHLDASASPGDLGGLHDAAPAADMAQATERTDMEPADDASPTPADMAPVEDAAPMGEDMLPLD
ncbi:MAG: hypothetical protein VYA30_03810 [Myxococcota bacterium]|nr:hypothetical protein [Myxococcota bacterium]